MFWVYPPDTLHFLILHIPFNDSSKRCVNGIKIGHYFLLRDSNKKSFKGSCADNINLYGFAFSYLPLLKIYK